MGEIDTKPIESVRASLSLFGEKNDQRRYRSTGSEGKQELEEKELNLMLKDLSNYKVQLEVKESSYIQALLKLELYQKTVEILSAQLKNSETERDRYNEERKEAETRIDELEFKIKEISDQLLESGKAQVDLIHAMNELTTTKEELLNTTAELAAAKESVLAAMKKAELLETAVCMEKEKTQELLKHISELNEAILHSKLTAIEAEKEKTSILMEEEDIRMATAAAVQVQGKLEEMKKGMDLMQDFENQLLTKTVLVDSLQLELKQVKEFNPSSAKAASDGNNDLNWLKSELELMEREKSDQTIYVESLEMEQKQLHVALKNAKEEVGNLNSRVEMLSNEIQRTEIEKNELKGRESEAQVKIAILKSELHKGRSKIAAAEAAEARIQSVKLGLYLAVQHLAIEAQEAKRETQRLKQEAKVKVTGSSTHASPQFVDLTEDLELAKVEKLKSEIEERRDNTNSQITISMEEYESMVSKAKKADQVTVLPGEDATCAYESVCELDVLKKELEAAMAEIRELRSVAEQAVSRAELAEKGKAVVEDDQLRKWRERKQRRRAALATLHDESTSEDRSHPKYNEPPATYRPLGKVLNIKY